MKRITWIVSSLSRGLASVSGLLIAVVMVIVCFNIAMRWLTGGSLDGAVESAILLLVALVFLGFAGAETKGENFSVTILLQRVPDRWARAMNIAGRLVSFATIAFLSWFCWLRAIASVQSGEQSYGVIAFPIWPSRLLVAVGLTLLALQFICTVVDKALELTQRTDD